MHSNAFNFTSFLQGGVDLRTGQYGISLPLVELHCVLDNDLSRSISLSFSMMNKYDSGYGMGWGLTGLSQYIDVLVNPQSPTLTLSTGETYQVNETDSQLQLTDRKLNDVFAQRIDDRTVCIIYKSGIIETLTRISDGDPFQLTRIQYENGQYFDINYQSFGSKTLPESITDSESVKRIRFVSLNSDGVISKIFVHTANNDELEYDLTDRLGDNLCSLALAYDQKEPPLVTRFSYETDFLAISTVENPMGGKVLVSYLPEGHLVGALSSTGYLPYVTRYELLPGNDGERTAFSYQYSSDTNFSGYPFNYGDPSESEDNLHYCEGEYNYWGKEILETPEGTSINTRTTTYNRFHLTISEVFLEGECSLTHNSTYNEVSGDYYAQPANLEIPRSVETIYEKNDACRSELNITESDEYGNETYSIDATGIETFTTYYESDGEENCPADPFGQFVRYIKQTVQRTSDEICRDKITNYKYQAIPVNTKFSKLVVQSESNFNDNLITATSYYEDADSVLNGQLACKIDKYVYEANEGKTKRTDYTYSLSAGIITCSIQLTGHDSTQSTNAITTSLYNGCQWSITDNDGITASYGYDNLGRQNREISAAGSEYEIIQEYCYTFPYPDHPYYSKTMINEWGIAQRTSFDGFGKELFIESQDDDGTFIDATSYDGTYQKVSSKSYDFRGRLVEEIDFDYSGGINVVTQTRTYLYDDWGEKCETHYNDGVVEKTIIDPILMTKTEGKCDADGNSLSVTRNTFNNFKKPSFIDILKEDQQTIYARTNVKFDGFGRPISLLNPAGFEVKVEGYDSFDRPLKLTYFDGTCYSLSYCDSSSENLVTSIEALIDGKNVMLGERQFDGLEREKFRCVSSVQRQINYQSGSIYPSSVVNGRNQQINFVFIPEIHKVSSISVPCEDNSSEMVVASFEFSNNNNPTIPAGVKLSARTQTNKYTYHYTETGRPVEVNNDVNNLQSENINHDDFTLNGVALSSNIYGNLISQSFDSFGRQISTDDGGTHATNTYDSFGRMNSITIYEDDLLIQQTLIEYDFYSRESEREIVRNDGIMEICYEYDNLNRIVKRTTCCDNIENLVENFQYDSRNRISAYHIENGYQSSCLPKNENGKEIIGQMFEYDSLNSITCIKTYFPSNEVDEATFTYHERRLVKISHSLNTGENAYPSYINVDLDDDGNITSMSGPDFSREFRYSALNRIDSCDNSNYNYDAYGRLISLGSVQRQYRGGYICGDNGDDGEYHYMFHSGIPVSERGDSTNFYSVDKSGSVVQINNIDNSNTVRYTPYGNASTRSEIGFNGERVESISGGYILGNGVRLYLPEISQFTSMDLLSPFSSGGLNPYCYCLGDPINSSDPSGYTPDMDVVSAGLGVCVSLVSLLAAPFTGGSSLAIGTAVTTAVLGTISSSLKLASELSDNKTQAAKLKKASVGFNIASSLTNFMGVTAGIGEEIIASSTKQFTSSHKLTLGKPGRDKDSILIPTKKMPGYSSDEALTQLGSGRNITRNDPLRAGIKMKSTHNRDVTKYLANPLFKTIPSVEYEKVIGRLMLKTTHTRGSIKGVNSYFTFRNIAKDSFSFARTGSNAVYSVVDGLNDIQEVNEECNAERASSF
ncbi:UNVERIFIED_ORG: RHS repeat-associated protein [Buttiauxella agrestis ATCC 33320]